ncbi:GPI mannosyltransferase 4 [Thraustotheca clavata]|uniref:Mannosyltransferase n=1 Tax=Thraustotheca clavata TaxID=74557 RepID=A0A1W0A8S6_9STRA|nr:GPI mannosyltransferase 4 [Thraustotheca clavata]
MYGTAAVLRLLCVLLMGMIHPDEYFQCPEVMAKSVYNASNAFIPWEYDPASPNRSILFPSVVAGIPYTIAKLLGITPSGYLFLLLPRFILTILSFGFDLTLYRVAKMYNIDAKGPLLTFATSWTTLVLLTRSFSNTFEAWLLMLSFAIYHLLEPKKYQGIFSKRTLLLGMILAFGSFTRFTFILFFFPLGVALVLANDQLLCLELAKKHDGHTMPTGRRFLGIVETALGGALAFFATACAIVLLDTWYFHGTKAISKASDWVIAPLNNLIYNMDPAHLADHGLHSRSNHWCINMQLLFGPLSLLLLLKSRRWGLLFASVVFPVSMLSLAPHQEARFLLPVVFPLVLATGSNVAASKWLTALWFVFNGVMVLWFGILHQGGLIPMLLSASNALPSPYCTNVSLDNVHTMLISGTYMPPRFAFSPYFIDVIDERLENMATPLQTVLNRLSRGNGRTGIVFVYPAAWKDDVKAVLAPFTQIQLEDAFVGSCGPFLSVESLPPNMLDVSQWTLKIQHIVWHKVN